MVVSLKQMTIALPVPTADACIEKDLWSGRLAVGLGERGGRVAFKIVGLGTDPDGSGPVLPNLVIEIVSPASVVLPNGRVMNGNDDEWDVRLVD